MATEIEPKVKKMNETLDQLAKDATAVGDIPVDKRQIETERINDALEKLNRDYKMIEMEVRLLPQEQKPYWKNEMKHLTKRVKEVQGELKWAKTGDQAASEAKDHPASTEEGLINYGDKLMSDIKQSVQSTIVMIDEGEKIGTNAAAQLVAQGQQLQKVSDDLYEIEDTLGRAQAITRRMARKVLTDKYVWGLTVLIVLAIIGVIALKVTGHTTTTSVSGA
eukprot:TRINITY_DN6522_c0_g1_i1.p1 TRINITY_DN6522_c0_g1~~TRINITY_DN6522_c0_g1_i1.p1  ORF type:complete len:221 (+),score=77.40 TRINITY_DN6522_c0_g1_i1:88-750(+)